MGRFGQLNGLRALRRAFPLKRRAALTTRLLPRKACRKADLPAPLAPSTLQRKTFLWVWPFSRSILFSRVTGRRELG